VNMAGIVKEMNSDNQAKSMAAESIWRDEK
jgi:hypothetical protein